MTRVEQLEQQIAESNPEELREFRAWDRQIESDSRNGKLRQLVDQALAADHASKSTAL